MLTSPWCPVWTWNIHQTHPDNGPHDRSILVWYQVSGLPEHGDESLFRMEIDVPG